MHTFVRIFLSTMSACFGLAFSAGAAVSQHVIIISIDGLPAYLLSDPLAPIPTLRRLAKEGAVAEGMKVSNPSVTWPNHTTLVTGVPPARHSVLFNGSLVRSGPGMAVRIEPRRDKDQLVAVLTLFDVAHRNGLTTAAINWPCTRNAPTLDDNFPDVPDQVTHMSPRLRKELVDQGILANETQASFGSLSAAAKDQIWTAAAAHVVRARKPNMLLFHILITDGIHHRYGAQTPAGYTAVALADAEVRDLLNSLEQAGIRERATVFIVADHGFETVAKILQPNVLLAKAGWLKLGANAQIDKARAQAISEGGIAMVYLTESQTRAEDRAKIRDLFMDQEGIAEVIEPGAFARLGLPSPDEQLQMADLILAAKPGYGISNASAGEEYVIPAKPGQTSIGYHGYLSSQPKMNAVFIAAGRGIKRGIQLGLVDNLDIAPTAAYLLGLKLPGAEGKVLREILEHPSD